VRKSVVVSVEVFLQQTQFCLCSWANYSLHADISAKNEQTEKKFLYFSTLRALRGSLRWSNSPVFKKRT